LDFTPDLAMRITAYVVLLFSLSVHESAHGWMAYRMGDDTAMRQGRVSLNPLVHIDPVGTVLIPLLQIFGGISWLLGWAKPTPVGAHNFRKLAQGHVLVASAGPVSNMLLALLFTAGLFAAVRADVGPLGRPVQAILVTGIQMNVGLAIFNLVPLPPLDGSWVVSWGLPRQIAAQYDRIVEPWGQWILLLLFMTGALGFVLRPIMIMVLRLLYAIVIPH
jgi:Zn-dependent protease